MKSFTILCFIFLFSAFVLAARAEEENEAPKQEDQPAPEVNDEEQPEETEENDEEETENNEDESEEDQEEDQDENVEKRSGYGGGHSKIICPKKCWNVCRPRICTRRVCKQYQCGYRKICRKVRGYKNVKKAFKVHVGDQYYGKTIIKYKIIKVPFYYTVCKKVPKYCTRCWVVKYKCGKYCRKVCKKLKCYSTKGYH